MKIKKSILFLSSLLAFGLAACSTAGDSTFSSEESIVNNSSSEDAAAAKTATANTLKKAGEDIFDLAGAVRAPSSSSRIKRALTPLPENQKCTEAQLPGVLVYLSGLCVEIEGANPVDRAISWTANYEFNYPMSGWVQQQIGLDIMVHLDKDNDKIIFYGLEHVPWGTDTVLESYIFIDIDFNFTANQVNGFKIYLQDSMEETKASYIQSVDGHISYISPSIVMTSDEFAPYKTAYDTFKAQFDAKLANLNTISEGNAYRDIKRAFVSTQRYANVLFEQEGDVRLPDDPGF